jgi:hypothetical protein
MVCVLTLIFLWRTRGLGVGYALLLVPVVVGLVPYAVNVAMTGEWQYNTAASKSLWYVPYAPLHETISLTIGWAINELKNTYLGLEVGRSPFPIVGGLLALLGVGVALMGRRRTTGNGGGSKEGSKGVKRASPGEKEWVRFFHVLLILTFVAGIGLALLLPPIHFNRYYMPYDFIFYLYVAMGALYLASLMARGRILREGSKVRLVRSRRWGFAVLISCALVVLMLPQFTSFFLAMSDSTRDIYYQQMTFSEWVRRYTPRETRLGVNDTGAHKYLSDRYVIDLIGLTSNYMGGAYFGGWGTVYDRLARLPEEERPTHLLIHPNVFLNGIDESVSQSLLAPVYSIRIQNPTITAGATEALYRIDWGYALLDASKPYLSRKDATPLDSLDVGNVGDEREHRYQPVGRLPSISEPKSIVTTAHYEEENNFSLSDSGRRHSGWEEFSVKSVAGRPLVLVSRSKLNPEAEQRLLVMANGREVGLWEVRNERGGQWQEYEYTIPAEYVTGDRTLIRIDSTFDPGGQGFASYHYWLYAP